MTLNKLENLSKIRQLKKELPDQAEFDGMIEAGARQLTDAEVAEHLIVQLTDEYTKGILS